ncbi:hypothetical protein [Azospirillum cavernae]|uniref:hypothetical protein n=1 Tax=Azospirillum cavernae TaxID=2320860 RepID=UPI001314A942|nr:hypothetical protein [Azospirillum cavernae]
MNSNENEKNVVFDRRSAVIGTLIGLVIAVAMHVAVLKGYFPKSIFDVIPSPFLTSGH